MKKLKILVVIGLLTACGKKDGELKPIQAVKPKVSNNGTVIEFPDQKTANFFSIQSVESSELFANLTAPTRVVATVVASQESSYQNLVLFDDPELTSTYTSLLQHLANINQIQNVNIKQRKIELERVKDLQQHGAATGREVLEAQTALAEVETNLINEKAANLEHEAKLKLGGFNPDALRKAPAKTVWAMSDIPENQLSKINVGNHCSINFTSYPNENFLGIIENIGDVVDHVTRMVKLRIVITNPNDKLKAGMFGTAKFGLEQGKFLAVPKDALITVMGKHYVFVKTGELKFERRQLNIGQQANNSVIVFDGITNQDKVVINGAMQLKGLSFGY